MPDNTGTGAPIASAHIPSSDTASPQDTNQGQSSAAPKSPAAEVPDFRKYTHKLKINESDEDVSYDDLLKDAQKGRASDRRFEQAAAKERKLFKMLDQAKKGDWSAIEQLVGEDAAVAFAEQRIGKVIDWNKLSKEQQEAITERREKEAAQAKLKDYEERESSRTRAVDIARETKAIDNEMMAAFSARNLKPTPELIYWAADYMASVIPDDDDEQQDYEPMPAEEGLGRALSRYKRDVVKILPNLPEDLQLELAPQIVAALTNGIPMEKLRAVLPKEFLDGLRKLNLKDVDGSSHARGDTASAIRRDSTSTEMSQRRGTRKIAATTDEMFASIEQSLNKRYK